MHKLTISISHIDDPYVLLIIFSHLDVSTLFKSCSLVCNYWNSTFFSSTSSFHHALIKICYLNSTSGRLNLNEQYRELFGSDDSIYSQFDEIKLDFIRDDSKNGNLFHQLLKKECKKKNNRKRKLITLNKECEFIPYQREAMGSIKQFYISNKLNFKLDSNNFINQTSVQFAVYYPFMVCVDNTKNVMTLVSLVSGIEFCKHVFESKIVVDQLQFKFHSQMQQYYKSKLRIDSTSECYIYSLYLLGKLPNNDGIVKKFLFIDNLKDDIQCFEDCTYLQDPLPLWLSHYITACDWDCNTLDVLLFNTRDYVSLLLEDNYRISFVFDGNVNNNNIPKNGNYPIIPIHFNNWKIGSRVIAANITNITKPLMKEGLALIDSEKYCNFSIYELKLCYENMDPGFECKLFIDTFYVLIAKKNEEFITNNNPYSIMWKVSKRIGYDGMLEIDVRRISNPCSTYFVTIGELQNKVTFMDQGRKFKLSTSFYYYNYLNGLINYIDDLSATDYWEYLSFTNVFDSWRYSDIDWSIKYFLEDTLKDNIKEKIGNKTQVIGNVEDYFYIVVQNQKKGHYVYSMCMVNYNKFKTDRITNNRMCTH
ncbi:Hypothetical protein NAEGRDRAFT_63787 [Naegleria gruberi]|uniref:F-box domain-containing protein n=1 Tax=Naegleria gruberi TaxID=5762 RepID=D2V5D9_NAEGR|nr:uncharacterized protein NAEGRDRAFT_63787 [Naegleria gruberi]EFC48094.1 Hypothetical protein NAEGRDRAFT_63787 [Naegleria gruberi]|eukprot:XP_002680838.1 Hypothetical protein NAEGRDRAFT_63787 [Naegleria gruberi strain NEG-M]